MVLKKPPFFFFFLRNISRSLDYTILFQFHQHKVQIFIKEFMERLSTSNVSNGNTEEF